VESADLAALPPAVAAAGWWTVRVEQPWRVAGKRIAPAPARLDEGWRAVLDHLREDGALGGPVVLGGRSAGARVACRSAAERGAAGVLALAFPLHPPGRPERSRAAELAVAPVPLLVVQGERDAFGRPAEIVAALAGQAGAAVHAVPGDHALTRDVGAVVSAVLPWLAALG
jgi:hypothetical protein